MARKRKENISEVMFSYVGTDAQILSNASGVS